MNHAEPDESMEILNMQKWTYVPVTMNYCMKMVKSHFYKCQSQNLKDGVESNKTNEEWKPDSHEGDGFVILFSDLTDVFLCRSSLEGMKARNSDLNSRLTVASDSHLITNVQNCLSAFTCSSDKGKLKAAKFEENIQDEGRIYEVC